MERSLKHMPVLSKKYFHASSPSVFGPYIIVSRSDKKRDTAAGDSPDTVSLLRVITLRFSIITLLR